jgi:hypothetical protein
MFLVKFYTNISIYYFDGTFWTYMIFFYELKEDTFNWVFSNEKQLDYTEAEYYCGEVYDIKIFLFLSILISAFYFFLFNVCNIQST